MQVAHQRGMRLQQQLLMFVLRSIGHPSFTSETTFPQGQTMARAQKWKPMEAQQTVQQPLQRSSTMVIFVVSSWCQETELGLQNSNETWTANEASELLGDGSTTQRGNVVTGRCIHV